MFPVSEQTEEEREEDRSFAKRGLFNGFRQRLLRSSLDLSNSENLNISVRECAAASGGSGIVISEDAGLLGLGLIGPGQGALPLQLEFGLQRSTPAYELCCVVPTGARVPVVLHERFMPEFRALYRYAVAAAHADALIVAVRPEDVNFFEGVICFRVSKRSPKTYLGASSICMELDLRRSETALFDLYAGTAAHKNVYLYLHSDPSGGRWTAQPASAEEWRLS